MKTLDQLKKESGGTNTNGSPVLFHFTYAQLDKLVGIVRQEAAETISSDNPPSAWKVGTRLFLHRSDAVEYQSYYVHHKIIPLYE